MKNIFKSLIWALAAVVMLGFTVACDDDELSTDQYSGEVGLNAFGPVPVVRGGVLRFYGSYLEEVSQVVIPGVDAITDITVVTSGKHSEIRVTVPTDGPEEGYVQLITSSGTTLTTETELYYTETIVFDSFSPTTVDPGDVLTIEGDYLNLIAEVIFSDGVIVTSDNFASQSRYTITVTVPDEAQTGVVTLADGDSTDEENVANLIEFEDELTVNVPVATITNTSLKTGDTMEITGSLLRVVDEVVFTTSSSTVGVDPGIEDHSVDVESLSVVVPDEAVDGAVSLLLLSGIEVEVGSITLTAPTASIADTETTYGIDDVVTITGTDLDLVVSAAFAVSDDVTATSIETSVNDEGNIELTVLAEAITGDITLTLGNGNTLAVSGFVTTKPTVTLPESCTALDELTLEATLASRIVTMIFGEAEADVTVNSDTEITVTVPFEATAGDVYITMDNGESVNVGTLDLEEVTYCVVSSFTSGTEVDYGELLICEVLNEDALTDVTIAGISTDYLLNGSTLYISTRVTTGTQTLALISDDKQATYEVTINSTSTIETVVWTGEMVLDSWSTNFETYADFSGAPDGSVVRVYYTVTGDYPQVQIYNGHWEWVTGLYGPDSLPGGYFDLDVSLFPYSDWGYTIIFQGDGMIITQISWVYEPTTETTVWEGSYDVGSWGGFSDLSWGGYDWSVLSAGDVLTAYFTLDTDSSDYWQIRFGNGSWSALPGTDDVISLSEGDTSYSIDVTQEVVDELVNNGGLVMTGCYYILTKITYQ